MKSSPFNAEHKLGGKLFHLCVFFNKAKLDQDYILFHTRTVCYKTIKAMQQKNTLFICSDKHKNCLISKML